MRHAIVTSILAITLVACVAVDSAAQAPSHTEAQTIWDSFWSRILAGDLREALRFVHPTRYGMPLQRPMEQLQEQARQMLHCRLSPDPLPGGGDDVFFEARCERAGEKASLLVGFRQDNDGAWRLTVI